MQSRLGFPPQRVHSRPQGTESGPWQLLANEKWMCGVASDDRVGLYGTEGGVWNVPLECSRESREVVKYVSQPHAVLPARWRVADVCIIVAAIAPGRTKYGGFQDAACVCTASIDLPWQLAWCVVCVTHVSAGGVVCLVDLSFIGCAREYSDCQTRVLDDRVCGVLCRDG